MARLAADADLVGAAAGQRIAQRRRRVEAFAALVERHHLERDAELHRAGIGRQHAGQQVDQRRLAGAVGADDADPVAARDAQRQILDHDRRRQRPWRRRSASITSLPEVCASLASSLTLPCAARAVRRCVAQRVQIAEPALVARAPRGDAVAQPVLLARDLAVELVAVELLLRQHLVAPGLELAEAAVQPPRQCRDRARSSPATARSGSAGHG